MVGGAFWWRSLTFFPWSTTISKQECRDQDCQVTTTDDHEANNHSGTRKRFVLLLRRVEICYARIAYRQDYFGINGRYFYVVLICREIVETAFQTTQAIDLSK